MPGNLEATDTAPMSFIALSAFLTHFLFPQPFPVLFTPVLWGGWPRNELLAQVKKLEHER